MHASTRRRRRDFSARWDWARLFGLGLLLVGLVPTAVQAQTLRGKAFVDARAFLGGPAFPDQRGASLSPSLGLEPEFLWENEAGNRLFRLTSFIRIDAHDGRRTHVDLWEASVLFLGDGRLALQPYYDLIDQVSLDAQWTRGPTLWKLEAMTRSGHGDLFGATVFGLEHIFFNLGAGGADLGVLGEVMLDGRDTSAPFTAADHDVFVGAR